MISIIKNLLLKIIENIDAGNSNITEKEAFEIIDMLKHYTDTTQYYNRTQAAKYLNCSVQSFDLYRKEGRKILYELNIFIRIRIVLSLFFYFYIK